MTKNRKLKAWCIDDSGFDRMLLQRVLHRSGYFTETRVFPSVREALEELRATRDFPDIFFVDMRMPEKNGFDFLKEATKDFGPAFTSRAVVVLTSSWFPEDRVEALSFPSVNRFCPKPLTLAAVRDVVGETCQSISQGGG
jgi:CheY-like chemotaxis protein